MPELWTLVFCDPEPLSPGAARRDRVLYWGLSFLKPGFRHVFAIRRLGAGAGAGLPAEASAKAGWLIANWHSGRLDLIEAAGPVDVGPKRFADYGAFVAAMAAAGLATTVTLAAIEPRTWRVRGLATCVTAAKHLMGIAAPGAQTPWGLYRHLRKGDAR
jgi:hypothetical protein